LGLPSTLGRSKLTEIGEKVPQPSSCPKRSRASRSMAVGATKLALMRRPVRLVGSGQVAASFGRGMSGSGWCARL
jgi:hypothetical protein